MTQRTKQEIEQALRLHAQNYCAPIWWESERKTVVNNGTMCVVRTPNSVLGITNDHVLEIYQQHKIQKPDIFCQLGSAPFDPNANLIARSKFWDIATFAIPEFTLLHWGRKVLFARTWPPSPIQTTDHVVFGGFVEARRTVPPVSLPPTMSVPFVSFRKQPHSSTENQVTFHVDPSQVTWLPNVEFPLQPGTNLSGMSGGPCFRLVPAENRIELGGIIYEGDYDFGIIFARQICLVSAQGQIAPPPM